MKGQQKNPLSDQSIAQEFHRRKSVLRQLVKDANGDIELIGHHHLRFGEWCQRICELKKADREAKRKSNTILDPDRDRRHPQDIREHPAKQTIIVYPYDPSL